MSRALRFDYHGDAPVEQPPGYAKVPEISRFLGIIITMHYSDHVPAHFHARYGSHRVVIGISPLRLIAGRLPGRAMGLVMEWASLHQDELDANWIRAQRNEPLRDIAPLE